VEAAGYISYSALTAAELAGVGRRGAYWPLPGEPALTNGCRQTGERFL